MLHAAFKECQRRKLIVALNGHLAQAEGERGKGSDDVVAVTLHSLLRMGERQDVRPDNVDLLARNAVQTLRKDNHPLRSWIVGRPMIIALAEISQWSIEMVALLHTVIQQVSAAPSKPWGGHQLVVSGDFYQSPPIAGYSRSCIYSSLLWSSIDEIVVLKTQHRQTGRDGEATDTTINTMNDLRRMMLDPAHPGHHVLCNITMRAPIDPVVASKHGMTFLCVTRAEAHAHGERMLEDFPDKTTITDFGQERSQVFAEGVPIMFNVRSSGHLVNNHRTKIQAVNGTMGAGAARRDVLRHLPSHRHIRRNRGPLQAEQGDGHHRADSCQGRCLRIPDAPQIQEPDASDEETHSAQCPGDHHSVCSGVCAYDRQGPGALVPPISAAARPDALQGQTLPGGVVTDAQSLEHVHIAAGRTTNIAKYRHSKCGPHPSLMHTPTGFREVIKRFHQELAKRECR